MKLQDAERIAGEIIARMATACERIQVAGSVRRRKAEPKDIEIVFIPRLVECRVDFFTVEMLPATDDVIYSLVEDGTLAWDTQVRRNGPKYKRLIHRQTGAVIELFAATAENWGLILALRTGPAEFNKALVAHPGRGGVMPVNMCMQDGFLWRDGRKLSTPDEPAFFAAMGLPVIEPERRAADSLLKGN